jgi:uncharacterized protein (TIGR03086 family)
MSADRFERAVSTSRPIVASITPGQLELQTPCRLWTVRELVNHMIDAPTFAAVSMENGEFVSDGEAPVDHASGDYLAAYDAATSRAAAAFSAEGAMSKAVKLPFGEMPGAIFVNIAAGDAFAHGWDLAKTFGMSTDLNRPLATELLEATEALLPDEMRGSEGQAPFGPKVEVSTDAPPADRFAGFLGRRP